MGRTQDFGRYDLGLAAELCNGKWYVLVRINFLKSFHIFRAWINHDKLHISHEGLIIGKI